VKNLFFILFITLIFQGTAQALVTELGLNYSYQKKTFNATNYYQSDSKGASVSFYFLEKLALEFNYTDSFYEGQESDTNSTRTVQQSTTVFDSSLIFAMLPKNAFIQPYIKGGVAYITKNQRVRYLNSSTIEIPASSGWAPSYGAGLKFMLTERFSIKIGYDVWQTSLSDGTKSDDNALKAGLSWYL
jgi:outer membrane protein W